MTIDSTIGTSPHPLDDPVRASLRGTHRRFASWTGRIGRYDPAVARFIGHPPELTAADWTDLAALVGAGGIASLRGPGHHVPPAGWTVVREFGTVQMDGTGLHVAGDPDLEVLTESAVPEILRLVARTEPGPYAPRTIEMGTYLGLRVHGRLIAMAGERLHPPGWTEISAVCTDAEFRGRGIATRLIRAVGAGIRARGEIPFLHALDTNVTAISLYETLGFTVRRRATNIVVQAPG